VANLPATVNRVPSRASRIRSLIAKGWEPEDIVQALAKGDDKKAKSVRTQIRTLMYNDAETQAIQGQLAKGALMMDIVAVTEALLRRAKKGNVPAIKLAMEASGFHNPRHEHHHSGKIEVELKGVQRAPLVVDESEADGNVVDADVVEE
jgi:hypothetical protein